MFEFLSRKKRWPKVVEICDFYDQDANDFIYSKLMSEEPCMIAKFGTNELWNMVLRRIEIDGFTWPVFKQYLQGRLSLNKAKAKGRLCRNAGFFPNEKQAWRRFYERMIVDIKEIDVLCSYFCQEQLFADMLDCKRVNLDGFYAPFKFDMPWTRALAGKRVLIIHPFVDTIRSQYENKRALIFENPNVLPEFAELLTLKAVQSMADAKNDLPYKDWFEALADMENQISALDFDVALIGCGAYGLPLAAHVKRMGKKAVQLAGWTQMLFGVYGSRWVNDQPEYAKFINEHWVRPSKEERPSGAERVEKGAYW